MHHSWLRRDNFLAAFIVAGLAFIYSMAGRDHTLSWDEQASVDIALGIRPSFSIDQKGLPTKNLYYEEVIGDTAFTAASYVAHNTVEGVIQSVMQDNSNSFFYYLTLHYLIKIAGVNFWLMRLFTIFVAAINLLLIWKLARELRVQQYYWLLAALLLVGINPIFASQAWVIRGYMLCITFLLAGTLVWLRVMRNNSCKLWLLIVYSICCLLAMLTHYFSVAIIAGQFIYMFLVSYRERTAVSRLNRIKVLIALLVLMAPLAVWYYLFRETGLANMYAIDKGWQYRTAGKGYELNVVNYLKLLFNTPAYVIGFDYSIGGVPKLVWHCLAAAVISSLLFLLWKSYKSKGVEVFNILLLLWLLAILVYSCRSWLSGHFMIFERKYLILLVPYLVTGLIVFGSSFASHSRFHWLVAGTGMVLVVVNLVAFVVNLRRTSKEKNIISKSYLDNNMADKIVLNGDLLEFMAVGKELSEKLSSQDTIVYTRWKTAHQLNYFLRRRPDIPQYVHSGTGNAETITITNGNQVRVFYVK